MRTQVVVGVALAALGTLLFTRAAVAMIRRDGDEEGLGLGPCCGDPFCGNQTRQPVGVPSGWRRLTAPEVTPYDRQFASEMLGPHAGDPYGSLVSYAGDRAIMIEQHCYEPGGAAKPWGYHPGVTLLTLA